MTGQPRPVEQVPPDVLRACPFCTRLDHGVTEAELWRHFVEAHAATDRVGAIMLEPFQRRATW